MNARAGGARSARGQAARLGAHERTRADATRQDALRSEPFVGDGHGVPRDVEATRQLPRGRQLLARTKATVEHGVEQLTIDARDRSPRPLKRT